MNVVDEAAPESGTEHELSEFEDINGYMEMRH
jgi:hypothetical protein